MLFSKYCLQAKKGSGTIAKENEIYNRNICQHDVSAFGTSPPFQKIDIENEN
jgi:hypothetical protein